MNKFFRSPSAGAIYVVDELDYETKQSYDLIVRATDSVSGVSAEVPVSIVVTDVNDSPPTLPTDNYEITVSESAPFGSAILKVTAQDNDTGESKKNYVLISLSQFFIRLNFIESKIPFSMKEIVFLFS